MPNWCWTNIIFHGHKNELEDLKSKIEEWTSENLIPNGFGTTWLGNIVCGAGLGDRIDNNQDDRIRCRGSVIDMGEIIVHTDEDSELMIRTETAWAPMVHMWDEIFNVMGYKTIGYSFQSEEEGMSEFLMYDPYGDFEDKYYVDIWLDDSDEENEALIQLRDTKYYPSDELIIGDLQELLQTSENNINILIDLANKYDFKSKDSFMYVRKYEQVDKSDMC